MATAAAPSLKSDSSSKIKKSQKQMQKGAMRNTSLSTLLSEANKSNSSSSNLIQSSSSIPGNVLSSYDIQTLPSPNSVSKDFKSFQESISHPVFRLGIAETVNAVTGQELTEGNPFFQLNMDILECLGELEAAVEDIIRWNHEELEKASGVASSLKLDATILFSKLFRSKSDLHQPLFELLNQIKLYAKTWNVNRLAMLELEKDYQRHYYVLDVAIRKLEGVESRIQRMKAQHNLSMWEKFALRVLNHVQTSSISGKDTGGKVELGDGNAQINNARSSGNQHNHSHQTTNARHFHTIKEAEADPPQLSWIITKQAIIDGIIDEPSWRAQLRQVIQNFKSVLTDLHPGWRQIMTAPWIKKGGFNYLSSRTGTCRPKKAAHIGRSSSLPNLRAYYAHEKEVRVYLAWNLDKDNGRIDERGMKVASKKANPLRILSPRLRCNSMNARHDLTELITNIVGGDATDIDQMQIQEEIIELNVAEQDPEDVEQPPEHYYFKDIMTPESHEAIVKLVKAQNTMESKIKAKESASLDKDDVEEKDTFNLAEVMELTLLHAQQLHVLKDEYEGRQMIMQEELDLIQKEKDYEISQLSKKIEALQAQLNQDGLRVEYKDSNQPRASSSTMNRSLVPLNDSDPKNGGVARRKSTNLLGKNSANNRSNSIVLIVKEPARKASIKPSIKVAEKPKEDALISFKNRNQHSTPSGPRFTSEPFTLSFFERLEWFSKASVKLHEKLRLESQAQEKRENERKLAYLNLIAEEEGDKIKGEIPAEFMPMPGNIPSSFKAARDSFIFSDQGLNGPWGGRFKIAEKAQKLNILNLFDIALSLPRDQQSSESEDESDDE